MKDLIIGCSSNYNWDRIKFWVNSINRSGFTGDKVLILMNCDRNTVEKILNSGFEIISFNQDNKGNLVYRPENHAIQVERYLHIYNYLRDKDYRYVITTDTKDVVFQKNPIEFIEENLGNSNLLCSSESILYKDEPWNNSNLLEAFGPFFHNIFKNNVVYNSGVIAGNGCAIRDLAANVFAMATNRPALFIDQAVYNFIISQEPYLSTSRYIKSEDGWAAQLGGTAVEKFKPFLLEPSPSLYDNNIVTSQGKIFTIVHQYDRIPGWKEIIEEKFND